MSYSEKDGQVIEEASEYPGYHYEWVVDESWHVGGDGLKCRMKGCRNPASAWLFRSRRYLGHSTPVPWHYCESHLYGRKLEDGVIKIRRLVENSLNSGKPNYTAYQVEGEKK